MKTETSKRYTAIIKGIQSEGFNVITTVKKILVICPKTKRQVFEGDIEAAEEWLADFEYERAMDCYLGVLMSHPNRICTYTPIERPPFRRNACILFALCILIYLGAASLDHPVSLPLGLVGLVPFFTAISYTRKHFTWGKKISSL